MYLNNITGKVASGDRHVIQRNDNVDEEIALFLEKKELFMKSKSKAIERIMQENKCMEKFINEKFEELRQVVKKKASDFEAECSGYENALLLLRSKRR